MFIDEVLNEARLKPTELDAVCVASGPGSYTGLRIGVSAAKGLCYGADIPLLSISSLESMAYWANENFKEEILDSSILCPMIDARRMEVYVQQFSLKMEELTAISAQIISEETFKKELEDSKVIFFGDGAEKCKSVIDHPNAVFLEDFLPSARGMIQKAEKEFASSEFEDVAYFEPYYLKDFVAGTPKKIF